MKIKSNVFQLCLMVFMIVLVTLNSAIFAQAETYFDQTVKLGDINITFHHSKDWWIPSERRTQNMEELVYSPKGKKIQSDAMAFLKIGVQKRLNHDDALQELQEVIKEASAPVQFLQIGGWPAVQRSHIEVRNQPSRGPQFLDKQVLRITTAVAVGDRLVRIEGFLPSMAGPELINQAKAIGQGLKFQSKSIPSQTAHEIKQLKNKAVLPNQSEIMKVTPKQITAKAKEQVDIGAVMSAGSNGAVQRVFTGGFGELEIAVSPDGQNIIIGRQSSFRTSQDGGRTFPISGFIGAFDSGDPSLSYGQSGSFYYAGIDGGCRASDAAGPFGYTCTGIARSTNNGATFPLVTPAVVCPNADPANLANPAGFCFPDQEHIAADRFNAAPGGDQIYSVWRNFNAGGQDPNIVCSQNNGTSWTAPLNVEVGAFIPRVGVGQDGFVYVIYRQGNNIRLHKYSSCQNGLTAQAGFPRTIASITNVACPVPGLDRCNNGNSLSSHTVAIDGTNANHIYVAYANNTAANNENILVRDSLDGGFTWQAGRVVQINGGGNSRRFMPWLCTDAGTAYVSWYDRRNATAANNDLTDYFGASAALDGSNNLTAGAEFQINPASTADAQCAAGRNPPDAQSWPAGTRSTNDSESCSVQPQLAGRCFVAGSNPQTGSGTPCDFSDAAGVGTPPCFAGESCLTGGGVPKYGDYNGNACLSGRFLTAWATATPPPGTTPSAGIDILFASALTTDISITKTDSSDPVAVDSDLTYTLKVTNNGPATASGVVVTDNLPATNISFISVTTTQGSCTGSGPITCNLGILPSGAIVTITVVVHVNDAGTLINKATVVLNENDSNTANNSATETTAAKFLCFGTEATIVGTLGPDAIVGTPGNDVIFTRAGNDSINSLAGDDRICSGDGIDSVSASDGNDRIDSGKGIDSVSAGSGNDLVLSGDGTDSVSGETGNDLIDAGNGFDVVDGGPGTDSCLNAEVKSSCP